MKTLKKTLCLVLAVVMVVGVLVLPANAAATTTEDTDATAAFKTLNEYGVMYGVDANHKPALDKNINRQDMAAIVYRIMTGDTKDQYVANYVGSAEKFADSATFATWAKGYIGYVRNNGIFMGDEKGNFKPTDNITGDEVLTVLLRCIGYGKNNEFTGASWAENAEAQATRIHLFGNADGYKDVKTDMSKVINRGVVAKLTFNAVQAPMVTYFNGEPSIYQDNQGRPVAPNTPDAKTNPSLISTGSNSATATVAYDKWGAPSKTVENYVYFNYLQTKVTKTTKTELKPVDEFWTPKTECDVATTVGLNAKKTDITFCTNGKPNTATGTIDPTNTTSTLGGQGRWTRIYDIDGDGKVDRVVYVDTVLAQVTSVTAHTEDAAGHVKNPAKMGLKLYLRDTTAVDTTATVVQSKAETDKTDFTYAEGNYVLVNYIQQDASTTGAVATTNVAGTDTFDLDKNVFVLSAAPSFTGKQTTIWYYADKHTIDNVEYNDNLRFHLDQAGTSGGTHTWFKDDKGNLIGAVDIATEYSYGVITKLWWSGNTTDGTGKAMAEVVYMDGSKATIAIDDVTVYTGNANTRIDTDTNVHSGKATYSIDNSDVMTIDNSVNVHKFYVATDADTNARLDDTASRTNGSHDIIAGHLFRFTADGDKFDVQEVAGLSSQATPSTGNNDAEHYPAIFGNFNNAAVTKNVSAIGSTYTRINSATKFLIRSAVGSSFVYTPVTGFENIGSYLAAADRENDYVDLDQDGFADLMYITAASASAVSVRTFYTSDRYLNGLNYTWGATYQLSGGVYTIKGYVDGVYGEIKVTDDSATDGTHKDDIVDVLTTATDGKPQFKLWAVFEKDGYIVDVIDLETAGTQSAPDSPAGTSAVVLQTCAGQAAYQTATGLSSTYTIPASSMYYGTSLIAKTSDSDDKYESSILTVDGQSYTYIAGKSIMVGDFSDLNGKIVSIVYDSSNNNIVLAYCNDPDAGNTPTPTVTKLSDEVAISATAANNGTVTVTYSEGADEEEIRDAIIAAMEKIGYTAVKAELTAGYSAGTNDEHTKYTYTGTITVGSSTRTLAIAVTAKVYYKVTVSAAAGTPNVTTIYLDSAGNPYTGVASTIEVTITGSGLSYSSGTVGGSGVTGTPTFDSVSGTANEVKGTLDITPLTAVTRAGTLTITLA